MWNKLLFERIDNSPLLIFRIFFGLLISLECFGAILTGWVKRNLVTPKFTFPFIDFEWLQFFTGPGMYAYFTIMGLLGICIALGYKYRFSISAFTFLWTAVYLMQKTAYNNHYYLLILISLLMCFFRITLETYTQNCFFTGYLFPFVQFHCFPNRDIPLFSTSIQRFLF